MKNKVLLITVIAAALIVGSSISVLAEGTILEDGKSALIDRSIFEPFKEKIEALKLKREEVHSNRTAVNALHDELLVEIEELRTNRDALRANPGMLTDDQKAALRTILEALNAEGGARKTLIATRGIQIPRIEAIKELRKSFRENPSDEPLDAIDALYDEVLDTQSLRINLLPEALELIKAANAIFEPTI